MPKLTTVVFVDQLKRPRKPDAKMRTYSSSGERRLKSNIWQPDYSYNKIAILCDMGVGHVSRIFRGLKYPSPQTVKKLAEGLGCSVDGMWRLLNL